MINNACWEKCDGITNRFVFGDFDKLVNILEQLPRGIRVNH
jgi:hypothetical protein